ncbi:MAG: aminotransferase class V-fold PLP-dependent enzyme [Actinobacteria bacterium]|nr:aminotransferase class V-fold PLP-dependent enzyme [Actinomycetota bacterium]
MKNNKLKNMIFFDNASTTRVDIRVYEEMLPFFTEYYGNPSSFHDIGQFVNDKIEESRTRVASLIGAVEEEIYFTSCGTESNNFALWGIARAYRDTGNHIITSSTEHYSILNPLKEMEREGYKVTIVPVDKYGFVNPEDIRKAVTNQTVLVSVMHANNEIGTIQNLKEISNVVKEAGIVFHSDGIAASGIIPVSVKDIGVDAYSFSSQQMYGPKGAAALYIKKGIKIRPLLIGGIQEKGRRAGTENVPSIIGFGKAAEIAGLELEKNLKYITGLRDRLISGIHKSIDKIKLNGHPVERLPGNVHIAYEFVEGESIILMLNIQGIAAASGSSCASHALKSSHVLLAIKLPPALANGSVLFSIGKYNTQDEVDKVLETLPPIIKRLREMSPLYK